MNAFSCAWKSSHSNTQNGLNSTVGSSRPLEVKPDPVPPVAPLMLIKMDRKAIAQASEAYQRFNGRLALKGLTHPRAALRLLKALLSSINKHTLENSKENFL